MGGGWTDSGAVDVHHAARSCRPPGTLGFRNCVVSGSVGECLFVICLAECCFNPLLLCRMTLQLIVVRAAVVFAGLLKRALHVTWLSLLLPTRNSPICLFASFFVCLFVFTLIMNYSTGLPRTWPMWYCLSSFLTPVTCFVPQRKVLHIAQEISQEKSICVQYTCFLPGKTTTATDNHTITERSWYRSIHTRTYLKMKQLGGE